MKRIKIYLAAKQLSIILDALELYEDRASGEVKEEAGNIAVGLSLCLPVEYVYPTDEAKREKLNADHATATPGERWLNRFNESDLSK